jgi:hypothetical protein
LLCPAQEKLPRDVAQFIEQAQMCEHFAGEWDDNDKARQREITQAVEQSCGQAQRQWKRLAARYAGSRACGKSSMSTPMTPCAATKSQASIDAVEKCHGVQTALT